MRVQVLPVVLNKKCRCVKLPEGVIDSKKIQVRGHSDFIWLSFVQSLGKLMNSCQECSESQCLTCPDVVASMAT
jgi:hypothetical protein